jgi:hypothetical protein
MIRVPDPRMAGIRFRFNCVTQKFIPVTRHFNPSSLRYFPHTPVRDRVGLKRAGIRQGLTVIVRVRVPVAPTLSRTVKRTR